MCIAVGFDYLPNVKGVGNNTAKKLVKEMQSFLDNLTKLSNAPQDYGDQFLSARAIFMHQTIFVPEKLTTAPLTQWSECNYGLNAKLQEYCGMYPFIHFFCLSSFYANIVYCIFICNMLNILSSQLPQEYAVANWLWAMLIQRKKTLLPTDILHHLRYFTLIFKISKT